MKSVLNQLVLALDRTTTIRLSEITYDGHMVRFVTMHGPANIDARPSPANEVEKWLRDHDPEGSR